MEDKTKNPQETPKELNYQTDIRDKDMRDIIAERNEWEDNQWNESKKEEAKPQEPTTPKEPAIDAKPTDPVAPSEPTKPAETVKEPEKPVIDEAKLTETLTENITKKLIDQFAPETATKEDKKDWQVKLKEMQEQATKEGRELTYEEAIKFVKEESQAELREELKTELKTTLKKEIMDDLNKEVAVEEEKVKQQKEARNKYNQQLYGEWDRQIGILQQQGFPKVIDKNDPNDPGMRAQKTLFEALNAINKEQQAKGQPVSLSLVEAFMHPIYKQLTTQPGKDAPVNGTRKSVAPNEKQGMNYMKDIHNAELRDIIGELYQQP